MNDFAKQHHGFDARIEIMSPDIGDQDMAALAALLGDLLRSASSPDLRHCRGVSSYYPAHLTHTIDAPRTVAVRYTPEEEIGSLLIVSKDKTETLVTLRRQPQLAQ